jgi:SAM-dependent methyltransferase
MVEAYNKLCHTQQLSSKMSAIQGDLLSPVSIFDEPKYFNFDIIVMSMALHHISDTQLMINKLQDRLNDGGVLVIIDWLTLELGGSGHGRTHGHGVGDGGNEERKQVAPGAHTVAHWGFSVKEMTKLFEEASMVDIDFMEGIEKSKVPVEMNYEQQMFIAKARKCVGH